MKNGVSGIKSAARFFVRSFHGVCKTKLCAGDIKINGDKFSVVGHDLAGWDKFFYIWKQLFDTRNDLLDGYNILLLPSSGGSLGKPLGWYIRHLGVGSRFRFWRKFNRHI